MGLIQKLTGIYKKKMAPIGYARRIGVTVGDNCRFIGSPNWGSEPWLISIGNHTEFLTLHLLHKKWC